MYKKLLILAVIFFAIFQFNLYSQDKADVKYWIIFKDKGEFSPKDIITKDSKEYNKGKELLSDRAIKRRLKVLSPEKLIDFSDVPLNEAYVNKITKAGVEIIAK